MLLPLHFLERGMGDSFLVFKKRERSIDYKLAQEASPIFHVSPDDPSFLLVHGKDEIVPVSHSKNMYRKLQEMNVISRLHVVESGAHGTWSC